LVSHREFEIAGFNCITKRSRLKKAVQNIWNLINKSTPIGTVIKIRKAETWRTEEK